MLYNPQSQISPKQGEEIVMGDMNDKTPDGYKCVSMAELRALYGTYINHDNLHMPMVQYLGMMLDIVRCMTGYKGVHVCKCPLDFWIFQEIIYERKPNVIIEIGNQSGGSTMLLRDYLMSFEIEDAKYVIGIDISRDRLFPKARDYPDIKWVDGDSCDYSVVEQVKSLISPDDRVMVIDDSGHEYQGTLDVLNTYAPIVTKGQYFIVEDTILGEFVPFGNKRMRAYQAVKEFMKDNKDFKTDRTREKWFITLNPEGHLEKIR